ncbi:phage tail tape measure protein [Rhodococcus globerulus]|uniref:Phage tail tape measure protein domain-containing protein n=1 Tax=Rhodococcus globerulus TaxID=33008 RepID=A0ABU4C3M7_RHOGO|nr:hypothetical protein [Rhodococcus globerulus]MDV6271108.1 hypothetical protein [Rhodococcus globerulus]
MASIGWASMQVVPTMQGIASAVNSQLIQPLQQAGQQAGQAAGQGVASGLASQRTSVEKASAQLAAARGKEADAAGKVRVAELKLQELRDKGTASASQIAAAEERLATANRGHDNAMGGRVRAVNNLTEARARAANGADDEADAVDDATDAQDRNGDSAVELVKKLGGLAIAAAGIGSAMDLATQSMEKSQLGSKLAASLGESPDEAKRYGEIAGNLYADGIGESMEDVAASVAAVSGTFGSLDTMGGARLEELSSKASNFAAVFDQDVAGSVETAGLMMQNGLADNADQAFDMLTKGMQEVSVGMREELPAILNEYGTNFRALGFNGADAFNMLISASQGGAIALDKTGDALKEFTIRGADMSTSSVDTFKLIGLSGEEMAKAIANGGAGAQDALQQTAEGLLKITDPAERANAAIALFGAPLEDMSVDKIPGFLESLAGTDDVMGDFTGATDEMSATLNDNAGSAFENMKRAITGELLDGLESMADWVGRNTELLKTIGTVVAPLVVGLVAYKAITLGMAAATATWNAIQMVLNGTMMLNPVGLIVAAIAGLVAAVILIATKTTWFQTIWDVVWGAVTAAWDWAWGKLKEGFELLKGAFGAIGDKVGEVKDWIVRKWDEVVGFVTGLPGRISSAVSGMWDGVKEAFKGAINWVIQKWNNFQLVIGGQKISIAGFDIDIPTITLNTPDIPLLATGGVAGRRGDGTLWGPGTGTSDSILGVDAFGMPTARVSAGEGVVKKSAMDGGGGDVVAALNAGWVPPSSMLHAMLPGYAEGGVVSPDELANFAKPIEGKTYLLGGWGNGWITDCSGAVSSLANFAVGRTPAGQGGRFATMTEGAELANRGFKPGLGPAGSLNVGWLNGGPAGGHTAATLPNGVNVEMGGGRGNGQYGGSAAGASNSMFTDHAHLPMISAEALKSLQAKVTEYPTGGTATVDSAITSTTSDTSTTTTTSPEADKAFSARERYSTMFTDIGGIVGDSLLEMTGFGEYLDLADRYTIKADDAAVAATTSSGTNSVDGDPNLIPWIADLNEFFKGTGLFDTGGVWKPGTFGFNGLDEPEYVLKDAHWQVAEGNIAKVDELVGAGVGGGPRVQITNNNNQIIADQASWQRDQASRDRIAIMRFGG